MHGTDDGQKIDINAGDRISLVNDDWNSVGPDIILVDLEPVPGSTQCIIASNGETRTVSRASIRPL